jgi:hypothetical protein
MYQSPSLGNSTYMTVNTIPNPPLLLCQLQLWELILLLLQEEPQHPQNLVMSLAGECRHGVLQQPLLPSAFPNSTGINNFQQAQHQPSALEVPLGVVANLNHPRGNETCTPVTAAAPRISFEDQHGHTPPQQLSERATFFILVKALFKVLEKQKVWGNGGSSQELNRLTQRVKRIISMGTRRNHAGDAQFIPLHAALARLLRQAVGDAYWRQAMYVALRYCDSKGWNAASSLALD